MYIHQAVTETIHKHKYPLRKDGRVVLLGFTVPCPRLFIVTLSPHYSQQVLARFTSCGRRHAVRLCNEKYGQMSGPVRPMFHNIGPPSRDGGVCNGEGQGRGDSLAHVQLKSLREDPRKRGEVDSDSHQAGRCQAAISCFHQ